MGVTKGVYYNAGSSLTPKAEAVSADNTTNKTTEIYYDAEKV